MVALGLSMPSSRTGAAAGVARIFHGVAHRHGIAQLIGDLLGKGLALGHVEAEDRPASEVVHRRTRRGHGQVDDSAAHEANLIASRHPSAPDASAVPPAPARRTLSASRLTQCLTATAPAAPRRAVGGVADDEHAGARRQALVHVLVEAHVGQLDGPSGGAEDVASLDVAVPRARRGALVDADVHGDGHVYFSLGQRSEGGLHGLDGLRHLEVAGDGGVVEELWRRQRGHGSSGMAQRSRRGQYAGKHVGGGRRLRLTDERPQLQLQLQKIFLLNRNADASDSGVRELSCFDRRWCAEDERIRFIPYHGNHACGRDRRMGTVSMGGGCPAKPRGGAQHRPENMVDGARLFREAMGDRERQRGEGEKQD
eukprot:scaffold3443_cov219-Pinguiococcus_pyrenoidosus.AAC.3